MSSRGRILFAGCYKCNLLMRLDIWHNCNDTGSFQNFQSILIYCKIQKIGYTCLESSSCALLIFIRRGKTTDVFQYFFQLSVESITRKLIEFYIVQNLKGHCRKVKRDPCTFKNDSVVDCDRKKRKGGTFNPKNTMYTVNHVDIMLFGYFSANGFRQTF